VSLGPLVAEPFRAARRSVVVGPAASGYLLGPLVATDLGFGFVPVASTQELASTLTHGAFASPPDDQIATSGWGSGVASDRVMAVDDLVDTVSNWPAAWLTRDYECGLDERRALRLTGP
jgi:adenine phosphoribosyltransferase